MDTDRCVIEITMKMEIEPEVYETIRSDVTHHIDRLLNLNEYPEIKTVFGCSVYRFE